MKKATILVLLSLCVLSVRAQNRFRAAVIEPAAPTAETGLVRHPWTGKKVLFIGDSISDCRTGWASPPTFLPSAAGK